MQKMTETLIVNFEDSLKNLNSVVSEIGRNTENKLNDKLPRFVTSCSRFLSAFNKVKNEESAVERTKECFYRVFLRHKEDITNPVFDEDNSVEDEWLRNSDSNDSHKTSSKKKKGSTSRLSINDIRYRGVTIYIDENDPALSNICIPLHEIYMEANRQYDRFKGTNNMTFIPYEFLFTIYYCFYFSLPDEKHSSKTKIMKNIEFLSKLINSVKSEKSEKVGTVFDGLENMINNFTSGNRNFDPKRLSSIVDGVIAPDNKEQFSKVYNAVTQKVQEKGDLVQGLKESMEMPEVSSLLSKGKELYSSASEYVKNNFNINLSSMFGEDSAKELETNIEIAPEEQE